MGAVNLSRRRLVLSVAVVSPGLILADTGQAEAHAQLHSAVPPVGASIRAAPDQISLVFSEGVEPAFSSVIVTDAAGTRVDKDDLHRDPKQNTRLIVGLRKITPGLYRVAWKVTSIDTHKTEGSYGFTLLSPDAS
jgi:copper resistance protein C